MSEVSLMQGDCLEMMTEIPARSVDLVLCDLPYQVTALYWDTVIPFEPLWSHYRRLLKPRGAVILTASQPFTSMLVMSNPEWFRYEWIWEKTTGTGFLDAKRKPLKCHESACVFYAKQPTYNPQKWKGKPTHGRKAASRKDTSVYRGGFAETDADTSGMKYPRSVIRFGKHTSTERHHKTQKPVPLMEYLILTYTNEGDTVLDNAMGSGTTGLACINTGRRFVGIEKDPVMFQIAERRIERPHAPVRLAVEAEDEDAPFVLGR